MRKRLPYLLLPALAALAACDEPIVLDLPEGEEDIVVYGFIEQDSTPFVSLTRSVAVFSAIDASKLQNSFVHNADVRLYNGDTTVQLVEYELPLGDFRYYFYSVPIAIYETYKGEVDKTYSLTIQAEGKTLTATTTIPPLMPLDTLWWEPHPDEQNDTLVVVMARFTDPPETGNFARYFTKRNSELFQAGYFASVFDDSYLKGQTLDFAIPRGQDRDTEIDETYSYFWKGDTVTVRWCAIDRPHYDFWLTLETDRNSRGNPFGLPTLIKSNVNGGLGVWGGYGASYHTMVIPK